MNAAKKYLLQIEEYEERLDRMNCELRVLEDTATSITATPKQDVVSCSGRKDKLGDLAAEIADKRQKRDEVWDSLIDLKREAAALLVKLDKKLHRDILEMRHFQHKNLKTISKELPMDYRDVRRQYGRALDAYARVLPESVK